MKTEKNLKKIYKIQQKYKKMLRIKGEINESNVKIS
jgi:hypothetical protein